MFCNKIMNNISIEINNISIEYIPIEKYLKAFLVNQEKCNHKNILFLHKIAAQTFLHAL